MLQLPFVALENFVALSVIFIFGLHGDNIEPKETLDEATLLHKYDTNLME